MFVADRATAPERFDHGHTLSGEQVHRDTNPNFLRKSRLTPAETEVDVQLTSVIVLTGFWVRLAIQCRDDGSERTR